MCRFGICSLATPVKETSGPFRPRKGRNDVRTKAALRMCSLYIFLRRNGVKYIKTIKRYSRHGMTVNDIAPSRSDMELWVVQKFGGTSIGKFPLNVVENVIKLVLLLSPISSNSFLIAHKQLTSLDPPPAITVS